MRIRGCIRSVIISDHLNYLEIHREIEVVKFVSVVDFNHMQNICLREAHRNVADHQRRQRFLAIKHCKEIDEVVGRVAGRRGRRDGVKYLFLLVMPLGFFDSRRMIIRILTILFRIVLVLVQ